MDGNSVKTLSPNMASRNSTVKSYKSSKFLTYPNLTKPNNLLLSYTLYALRLQRAVNITLSPIFKDGPLFARTFYTRTFSVAPHDHCGSSKTNICEC